jgi:hypothetical protein
MITSRYYNIKGEKWEARFFRKGEMFPATDELKVLKQGVWARPAHSGWEQAVFMGESWKHVSVQMDVLYMPK